MLDETLRMADGDARGARRSVGRVAPRESDERLLREYADKMDRGEVTAAAGRAE